MIAKLLPYQEEAESADNIQVYKAPLSLGEEFGRGVGAGVEELKGIGAGAIGALGAAVGSEGLEDWGYTTAQERFAEASSPELSGEVNSIFDIEDAGDFVSWAARTMGKQAPQLAFSVLGGGVGGIVGKKAVSSAITEALEAKTAELVSKGIAANVAKEQAQFTLSREMGENIATKLAAERAAQAAAMKTGIAAAGSVQGVGMQIGSIYADTRDLGLAVKYGVPSGAVEGITDLYFGSKIVDALAGKQATRGFARELGAVAGVGTVMEGGTEVGQTRLEQMARAEADPNYDINSEGATRELMEAGAAGALTGGVMGGGTTIASRLAAGKMAPLTMRALQEKETGLPDGTTPAEQQPDDPASLYQFDENPVTIDDGGKALIARRFQIGTEKGWAIDNPTEEEKMFYPPLPGGRVALLDGMVHGNAIRHNLANGGRLRNLGPGDSRSVEDDSDYEGYGMRSPEFPGAGTAAATGDSRLDTEAENAVQSEQRRFEDQALAPYRTLRNVFNAIDAIEKAGSSEERAALLQSATDPQELRDARYQLRAAKNQAKTPQEKQFFADLQGRLQDFNALKQASRALGIKSQDGQMAKSSGSYPEDEGSTPSPATPFEGASNLAKGPNPVEQATRRWAGIVEGKAQAKADFYAAQELKQEVPQESTGFESYDEYEKILAERAENAAQLKSLRGTISKGSEQDKQAAKDLIKELEDRQNALSTQESELLQKSSKDDEFLTELQKQTSAWELSDKNTNKWDALNKLQNELEVLQSERDELVTDEQRETFDADKNKGQRFEQLLKEVDEARKKLTPDKKKQEIVKSAYQTIGGKRKVAAEQDKVAAPQRESLEKDIEDAQARDRELDTKVVYTDPQTGSKLYGALVPDPQTGKATNANGNFLFMLRGYGGRFYSERSSGPLAGTPASDLNDPRATNYEALKRHVSNTNFGFGGMDQFDQPIEFTPQQMVNVAADTRSDLHEATKKQAKEKGIEGADDNTYIQNEVALAQKKRDEEEAAEDARRMSLEPVEVRKLREGDLVGFRLPDNERLHHTHFLSTGVKLTPTSAGKFRTAQNKDGSKQVIFDRYYVASPRGTSTENHLGKVSLPVMRPSETLVTLSDLSDAEKVELGYKADESTGETISEDLWKYLYKPPTETTFAAELGARGQMSSLKSDRLGMRLSVTPGQGFYDLYELKGDLTETEKILTLALGKFSPNPTEQDLIAAGFTPTGKQEEVLAPNGELTVSKIYDGTIPDPVANSGLQIPIKSAILVDKKNPKAPRIVKTFATFDPAAVLEAKRNLEEKKNAPDSPQKNANIDIAEKALKTAVWELQRLTLAQMNAGLDVRVKEDRNGIPITEALAEYGFRADRSRRGVKQNKFGKHIITRVTYNPNPDFEGEGQVFTRKVPTPKLNQQQAAGTLTNESLTMRGFDRPKAGLGAANEVLGNVRPKKMEQAQKAKEREEEAILSGSDLMSRHARELSNLTAFTRPIFEQYVSGIRRTIEESPNDPALKDRALMEAELLLARELNKFQMKAMPESVARELRSQIKTLERQAEAIKPVRGKKRVLKKGKDFGKLVDDPAQTKTQFEKQQRQWKQNLEKAKADLSDRFYRQMIPRATKGKAGVTEIKKIESSLAELENLIRSQIASEKIPTQSSASAVADAIKADKQINSYSSSLAKAKGEPAKTRWKKKIEIRKQEIEKSLVAERNRTEGEVEVEYQNRISKPADREKGDEKAEPFDQFFKGVERAIKTLKKSQAAGRPVLVFDNEFFIKAVRRLRMQLDRAGELTASQEGLLDSFLGYVQAEASKTDDQNRKTVTENLRRLLGRQKEAREGGRQMFINVRKEIEKVEKKSAKKQAKQKGQDAAKLIRENEAPIEESQKKAEAALEVMSEGADELYEKASEDYIKALDENKAAREKALSPGDKEILRAFGKIMDEVKALKIFGTGKVPGIVTQAFSAASNFKNAIEKREFFDPQTGQVVGPESEIAQAAIAGEIDPLSLTRVREPRKSNAEIEEQKKQELARDRLEELAEGKLGKYGTIDPNLIELAFVKLFGGEFNGVVEGQEINATYPPLEEKYSRPLFRYMRKDFGSTPAERMIVQELGDSVLDDYLFNPDAKGITDTQLFDTFAIGDKERVEKTPKRLTEQRPRGATVKTNQAGQRVFSLAAKNQGDITQSNRDAVQTPSAPAATGGRATQQFVQEYAGLSDAEMVALGQEEIDAIYRAATSKADADLAESAMDSVIATSPSIEQLAEQDVDTLRRGLLEEVKAKQSRGDAEAELRKNLRDASKNRLFKSTNDFLNHIAGQPAGINRATAMRAKEFLKLNGNGSFNWNKIGLQVSSFGKGGKAVNWAGASAVDSESRGGMALYINLDAVHNGGLVQTVLEEMDHALTHQIINHEQYGINLNPVQKAALDRLRTAHKQAVLKAGDGMTDLKEQTTGMTPEEKVAFYSGEFMKKAAEAPEQFRPYYNLTNLDEFVVGVKQDKDFHDLLIDLGFNEKTQGGGFSLSKFVKDLFTSLAELLTGRRLDPNSELARVFQDSWTLSTERPANQWTVPPTKLSMALGLGAASDATGTANGLPQTVRMQKDTGAFYNASLVQDEDGNWSVQSEFGSPGQKPRTVQKNKTPLDYGQAKAMFDKLVEGKSKKYSILPDQGPDGGGSTTPPQGGSPAPGGQNTVKGGGTFDNDTGPKSLAGARANTQRWNELTADLQGRDLTQADLDAWKKANPEKYAELEKMRENAIKSAGFTVPAIHIGGGGITKFESGDGDLGNGIYFGTDEVEIRDFVKSTGRPDNLYKVFLKIQNPMGEGGFLMPDAEFEIPYDLTDRLMDENEMRSVSLNEFNAATGTSYDAIIDETMYGTTYMVKDPNQIKSAEPLNLENGRLVPPTEWAKPENPDIRYSLAGARTKASKLLSGKKEGTTYTGQKVTTGGWLSSDPNAPANIEGLWNKSTALKGSDIALAEQLGSKLNKQAERYAKAGTPLDQKTVQTALGDIENPYTEEQKRQIDQAILENRAEDAAVLKTEFYREHREDFRRRQAEALAKLPQDIQELIGQMRGHIDPLSGYVDETMGFEVAENFGIYLNRSYLNFGDERTRAKWQEQVRENPKIMQDLRGYVLHQLADHDAEALVRRATREGRILPRAQAVEDASKALTEADIAAGIERVLNYGERGVGTIYFSGKIPGQKPMKVLDERGNVAPEIRAAWGMVEDPATNYVNTAMKLTALVSNDRFLQELKDEGLKTGMLYDPMNPANISAEDSERLRVAKEGALAADPTLAARSRFKPELLRTAMAKQDPVVASILEEAMDPTNIPVGYVKLSGETNKSLAPVSGMYAEPTLADWMFQKFPPQGATENAVMNTIMQLTLIPMAMKTVGSVAGQVRNYLSGWQGLLTAGNLRLWDAEWRRDVALAHKMTFGNVFGADAATRKAVIQARKRFGELGLMDQGITANFMQDLVGMNASNDASVQKGFLNLWNKGVKFAVKAYGASDDNFKIIHYLSELGKLRRAFPGESQQVLEERAAQIARDIHQTYSDTYGAVKALKKVPFIAPFISFTSEVIRNSINLVRLARNEIREGKRTGNKELERNGWNRVTGMATGWGGTFALTALSRALVGITPEEEDDLRRLLPDWQKNSQLLFLGKSNGKIQFVDISFSDPSNYLKRPVIALTTALWEDDKTFNERIGNGVSEAVMELAKPFISEQLFSGAVMDVMRNRDASGREIVNWQDTPFNIAKGITGHIGQVFLPGTLDTVGRVYKGWTGEVSDSGRSYDFGIELTAAFGIRPSEVDVRQSLGFRSRAFMQGYRDAASLFSRPFLSQGTKSAGDIESGYQRANDAYRSVMENFRQTYLGAIRLGVPANEVRSILKANGISDEVLSMIQSGRIQPYKASKQAIARAREAGQTPRIQEYERAYATASRDL